MLLNAPPIAVAVNLLKTDMQLFSALEKTVQSLPKEPLSSARLETTKAVSRAIQAKINAGQSIRLNFICTHNSRRSHFAQIWAACFAQLFKVPHFYSYSAGTAATALYKTVSETLQKQGFEVNLLSSGANPLYTFKCAPNASPSLAFSKNLEHPINPKTNFVAIMTCSHANEACPVVRGAEARFALPYSDPKAFDHSPEKEQAYQNTSLSIARELYAVFAALKEPNVAHEKT
jgi:arsenate reductase